MSFIDDLIRMFLAGKPMPVTQITSAPEVNIPEILATSYPSFARKAARLLESARAHFQAKGQDVGIHFAFRSFETQAALYAIGRTVRLDEKPVTKAKPGLSYHNYGIAIDIVFDGDISKIGMQWSWDDKLPWQELGEIGEAHGFEWAGRWQHFTEMPHFQITGGMKERDLLKLYQEGGLNRVLKEFDQLKLAA